MNERPSTLGARVSGRRAGQRFDADNGIVTEATIFLGDLDPEAIGPNIVHATHYEPTPVGDLERLLAHVPFPLDRATFVDLGAGMGRALVAAARFPFRQVIGVEISPALVAVARDNLRGLVRDELRCRDIRVVRADAAVYAFPRGDLVVYLYNPFDAAILERALAKLAARPLGNTVLLYHTPVERATIESHRAFELGAEELCGCVYRVVPPNAGRGATP